MESAPPSPEPRHVCPGSLVKWKPQRWVWNPGPHRALSEDWGPACSPVSPATPVAPPSLQNQLNVQLLGGIFGVETARGHSGA